MSCPRLCPCGDHRPVGEPPPQPIGEPPPRPLEPAPEPVGEPPPDTVDPDPAPLSSLEPRFEAQFTRRSRRARRS